MDSVNIWIYIAVFFMVLSAVFICIAINMYTKAAEAKEEIDEISNSLSVSYANNKSLQNNLDKLSDEYDVLKKKYEEGGPLIRRVVSEIPIVWFTGSQRFDQELIRHQVDIDEEEFSRTIVESILRRDLVDKILSDHLYYEETRDDPVRMQTVKTIRIGIASKFGINGVEFCKRSEDI